MYLFLKLMFIGIQLICKVVLAFRCIAKRISYIYTYIYTHIHIYISVIYIHTYIHIYISVIYIHTHTYIHSFSLFFPYKSLQSIEQSSLCYTVSLYLAYLVYIQYVQQYVYVNPNLPIYPSPPFSPHDNYKFSTSLILFLFCKQVHQYHFLDSTYKHYHDICFLCVTYFTQYDHLQTHPCWCKWHYFVLFLRLSNIPLHICTTSLSFPLLMDIQDTSMCWLL